MLKKNTFRKFFLSKKKIIVISENKIKSREEGAIVSLFKSMFKTTLLLWMSYTSYQFFIQQTIIEQKVLEIANLNLVNQELNTSIEDISLVVRNIKNYFGVLNKYDRFATLDTKKIADSVNLVNKKLLDNETYIASLPVLDRANENLSDLNNIVDNRIANLESKIVSVGIDENNIKDIYRVKFENEGNSSEEEIYISKESPVKKDKFALLNKKFNYMNYLENFINSIPFSQPLSNYRFTSMFGFRNHPFDKETKFHRGLDMAGPLKSKIVAPADGKVIYAGTKYGYGNYVRIAHGNSITTEYGHLRNFKVKNGDVVKRGQEIAVQGNTGRSTGEHLHYEIKFDKKPLNPKNFIDVGKSIF